MKLGSQVAGKRGTLDVPRLLPPDMLSRTQKAFAAKNKTPIIETVGSLDEKKLQKQFKELTKGRSGAFPRQGVIPMGSFIKREAPNLHKMLTSNNSAVRGEAKRLLRLTGEPIETFGVGQAGKPLQTNFNPLSQTAFINAPGRDDVISEMKNFVGPLSPSPERLRQFPSSFLNKEFNVLSSRDPGKLNEFKNALRKIDSTLEDVTYPEGRKKPAVGLSVVTKETTKRLEGNLPRFQRKEAREGLTAQEAKSAGKDPYKSTQDDPTTRQGLVALNRLNPAAYKKIEDQVLKDANKFTKKFPVGKELTPEAAAELKKVLRRKFYKGNDGKRQLLYERVMTAQGETAPIERSVPQAKARSMSAEAKRTSSQEASFRKYDRSGDYVEMTGSGQRRQFGEEEGFGSLRAPSQVFPFAGEGLGPALNYISKNHPEKSDLVIQILQGPSFEAVTKKTAQEALAGGLNNPLFQIKVAASKGSKNRVASKFNKLVEVLGKKEANKIRELAPGFIPSNRI